MTAYRHAEFLPPAIDSVLSQDVDSLELIIVDDGSPEDIQAAIAPYADRVRYVRRENGGLGAARDTGICLATAPYIAFCDSDDIQYDYRLSAHIGLLEKYPDAAVVFSDLAKFEEGQVTCRSTLRERRLGLDNSPLDNAVTNAFGDSTNCRTLNIAVPEEVADCCVYVGRVPELIASRHIAWGGASMFRKDLILDAGGHDPNIRRFTDWSLVSRLSKSHDLIFWDTPVLDYRQHPAQLTQQGTADGIRAYRDVVFSVWKDDPLLLSRNPKLHSRLVARACLQNAHYAMQQKEYGRARHDLFECIRSAPLNRTGYTQLVRSYLREYLVDPVKRGRAG